MLEATRLARTSVLTLLLIGALSPVPTSAAVLFDNSKADKAWDITLPSSIPLPGDTNGHYINFFKGFRSLGNPSPVLGPDNAWVTTATTTTARIKKAGNYTCDSLTSGTAGFSVNGPTYNINNAGYFPTDSTPPVSVGADYCDFHFAGVGIPTGTPLSVAFFGTAAPHAIAGSDSNSGTSFDGFYGNPIPGGFAFQLCDIDGCLGGFSTTTTPTTTPSGPSSVLFLPGIESSRLYEGNDVALWEPAGALRPTGDLALDAGGNSVGQDIYTKDVIDEAYGHGPNIYKTFLTTLETLKFDPNGIKDYEAIPYDWRLSLQDNIAYGNKVGNKLYYSGINRATSTPYIIQELKKLATESKSGKVTIVAHSNGGLLTKELLIEHPELNALVDKIIFVDVPQVGTPEAFGALMHGENQGIPADLTPFLFTKQQARTLSNNMPMTYNLLPSQGYFTYVDDEIATIDPATLPEWITQYGDSIHSNDRLNAFVNNSTLDKVLPSSSDTIRPTIANAGLLSNAQTLHASLDDWQPAPTTQLIQIAGWGVPTAKSISYKKKLACIQTGGNCVPQYVLDYEMKDTIDGDGTVVTPSQLWTDAHLPNVKNYFINLDTYNKVFRRTLEARPFKTKHADILEINDVKNFIAGSLIGTTTLGSYPLISTQTPVSTDSRLRYSLHSPLTLNLYDNLGNHTGLSTTTGQIEEQIPGTYYVEFGDVKYLFTDASSSAHIQMSGYATSTFTFNVDQLEGDTLLASTTFKDIPVTPATQVNLEVVSDISTLSPMHVDLGDGVDHAITPKTNGVATLDLTPPEITLAFSTSTTTLVPTATDESGTPILTTETVYPTLKKNQTGTATTTLTAVDSSGNSTVFVYTFKYPTKDRRITVIPVSLSYNGKVTKLTNTSAKYKWNLAADLSYKMLASYIQTVSTSTESHFRPKKNVTIVMTKAIDLDDTDTDDDVDTRAARLKLPGLVVLKLVTKQGKVISNF